MRLQQYWRRYKKYMTWIFRRVCVCVCVYAFFIPLSIQKRLLEWLVIASYMAVPALWLTKTSHKRKKEWKRGGRRKKAYTRYLCYRVHFLQRPAGMERFQDEAEPKVACLSAFFPSAL